MPNPQQFVFANNASTTLAAAASSSATTMTIASATNFPSTIPAGFVLPLTLNDAATRQVYEVCYVTAITGTTLTVERGQEGTAAQNWNIGDFAFSGLTAGVEGGWAQPFQLQAQGGNYAADTGASNAYVAAFVPVITAHAAGLVMRIKIGNNNTAASTLNAGAGAASILHADGSQLNPNDLIAGMIAEIVDDGTNYRLVGAFGLTGRVKINVPLSLYVSTTGSDSNNGLTAATPFATLQHAWNYIQQSLDLNGQAVTVNVAAGTYTAGLAANGPCVGCAGPSAIIFSGAGTASTTVNVTNGTAFYAAAGAAMTIENMTVEASGSGAGQGFGVESTLNGSVQVNNVAFGACGQSHVYASFNGSIWFTGPYSITGSAPAHWRVEVNGSIYVPVAVTLTGTPAFSSAFAVVDMNATVDCIGSSFTGAATGTRYAVTLNGVVNTNGGGANFLPGNAAGTTATGGQYA